MCAAPAPAAALAEAARACAARVPGTVFVGLAVPTRDRQAVCYTVLHAARRGAPRPGPLPAGAAAAGVAVDTKAAVHARDLRAGSGLDLDDLQWLAAEHGAECFYAAPLVLAHTALGALCLASARRGAFEGREELLRVVAAMCAPYVTLVRSHQELLVLEGLVTRALPLRVALQLREAAAAAPQPLLAGGNDEGLGGAARSAGGPGAAGGAGSSAAAGPQPEHLAGPSVANGQHAPASVTMATRARQRWQQRQQRQQQPQPPQPPQQPQQPQQQQQQQPPQQPQPRPQPPQPQPSRRPPRAPRLRCSLAFSQPALEAAFLRSACGQWLRRLDAALLLLSLASALGGRLRGGLTGRPVTDGAALVLAALVAVAGAQHVAAWPARRYLAWRGPCVAGVRLLRPALLLADAARLPRSAARRPTCHGALCWSAVEVAGCGLLVMQGLVGHLPLPLHALVQAAAAGAVLAAARLAAGPAPPSAVAAQLLLAWLVPVAAGAVLESRVRAAFLPGCGERSGDVVRVGRRHRQHS
ncbi:hypothetical protein HT031_005475 [Scenedesmus sp. PABB004]|nr:hypothetical protein HT031_005475 [Scenedesmus sp. PABB004]